MNLSKKSKLLIGILLFGMAVVLISYNYIMKPPPSIEERVVALKSNASEIYDMVQSNPSKWEDKVVEISGEITSIEDSGVTLNNNIYCQFKTETEVPTQQKTITVKGRIIGYDELLEELKLDQCVIEN